MIASFVNLARALQHEAASLGLETVPAFRSTTNNRALRRRPAGTVVLVNPAQDEHSIAADMIDGVIAANRLTGDRVDSARVRLWEAASSIVDNLE